MSSVIEKLESLEQSVQQLLKDKQRQDAFTALCQLTSRLKNAIRMYVADDPDDYKSMNAIGQLDSMKHKIETIRFKIQMIPRWQDCYDLLVQLSKRTSGQTVLLLDPLVNHLPSLLTVELPEVSNELDSIQEKLYTNYSESPEQRRTENKVERELIFNLLYNGVQKYIELVQWLESNTSDNSQTV